MSGFSANYLGNFSVINILFSSSQILFRWYECCSHCSKLSLCLILLQSAEWEYLGILPLVSCFSILTVFFFWLGWFFTICLWQFLWFFMVYHLLFVLKLPCASFQNLLLSGSWWSSSVSLPPVLSKELHFSFPSIGMGVASFLLVNYRCKFSSLYQG